MSASVPTTEQPRRSDRVSIQDQLSRANARRLQAYAQPEPESIEAPQLLPVTDRAQLKAAECEDNCEQLITQLGAASNRLTTQKERVMESLIEIKEHITELQAEADLIRMLCVQLDLRLPALLNSSKRAEWGDFIEDCLFDSIRATAELAEIGRSSSRNSNRAIADEYADLSMELKKRQRR